MEKGIAVVDGMAILHKCSPLPSEQLLTSVMASMASGVVDVEPIARALGRQRANALPTQNAFSVEAVLASFVCAAYYTPYIEINGIRYDWCSLYSL